MVVAPISADQPWNAVCCATLGLGAVIERASLTPEVARQAALAVLRIGCEKAICNLPGNVKWDLPSPTNSLYVVRTSLISFA